MQKLVEGQVAANDYIKTNPFDAQTDVSNNIAKDHRQGRSRATW